jgi:hypothetical protein
MLRVETGAALPLNTVTCTGYCTSGVTNQKSIILMTPRSRSALNLSLAKRESRMILENDTVEQQFRGYSVILYKI